MSSSDDRMLLFSELLQESRSRVFGLIYALVLNLADTEDLFQQTSALLWEKFGEYEPGTDFTSWALRVARFKTANFLRSRYREQKRFSSAAIESLYEVSLEASDATQQERLDALTGCLNKLPDGDRRLVQKCYAGSQQIREIAEAEGRTAGALYAALHRIRQSLLQCMSRKLAHP
jgi:RNA polymerase sigma-70 factor, ECF subfamily